MRFRGPVGGEKEKKKKGSAGIGAPHRPDTNLLIRHEHTRRETGQATLRASIAACTPGQLFRLTCDMIPCQFPEDCRLPLLHFTDTGKSEVGWVCI